MKLKRWLALAATLLMLPLSAVAEEMLATAELLGSDAWYAVRIDPSDNLNLEVEEITLTLQILLPDGDVHLQRKSTGSSTQNDYIPVLSIGSERDNVSPTRIKDAKLLNLPNEELEALIAYCKQSNEVWRDSAMDLELLRSKYLLYNVEYTFVPVDVDSLKVFLLAAAETADSRKAFSLAPFEPLLSAHSLKKPDPEVNDKLKSNATRVDNIPIASPTSHTPTDSPSPTNPVTTPQPTPTLTPVPSNTLKAQDYQELVRHLALLDYLSPSYLVFEAKTDNEAPTPEISQAIEQYRIDHDMEKSLDVNNAVFRSALKQKPDANLLYQRVAKRLQELGYLSQDALVVDETNAATQDLLDAVEKYRMERHSKTTGEIDTLLLMELWFVQPLVTPTLSPTPTPTPRPIIITESTEGDEQGVFTTPLDGLFYRGTAEAGHLLNIYVSVGETNILIGETQVDENGVWEYFLSYAYLMDYFEDRENAYISFRDSQNRNLVRSERLHCNMRADPQITEINFYSHSGQLFIEGITSPDSLIALEDGSARAISNAQGRFSLTLPLETVPSTVSLLVNNDQNQPLRFTVEAIHSKALFPFLQPFSDTAVLAIGIVCLLALTALFILLYGRRTKSRKPQIRPQVPPKPPADTESTMDLIR